MNFSDWKEYKLDEVYEFSSGLSKNREEFGSGYEFLSFKDVFYNYFLPENLSELVNSTEKEREKCSIKRGDVFLTRTSETLDELGMSSVALKDYENATFNGFTKRLRPKGNISILPEYVAYYFRSPKFRNEITCMSSMTTRASLNNDMLSILKLVVPPLSEQKAIAKILLDLDSKIENNNKINKKLEEIAKAIFKQWFVDFEFPQEGMPYKSSDGKMKKVNNDIIPEDWEIVSLSEIMDYKGGSQPPAKEFINEYEEGYIRFIQIRDYDSDRHITYIPISKKNKLCSPKDIMIARYGASLGRICYGLEGSYNVALAKVFPKKKYYEEYLRSCLRDSRFYKYINSSGDRSAQSGFNQNDIDGFKIAFPINDDTIVCKYNSIISLLIDYELKLKEQNRKLVNLKEILLPKLINGEINLQNVTY